jgi:type IV fimbrial biogenesis protein FimT
VRTILWFGAEIVKNNPFKNKGLTMLELMITLAIAGILIASAAPSFRESIQNTRMVTQVNELQAALSLARSEAVKRNENVTVCPRDPDEIVPTCADNWQDGWIVFVDLDSSGDIDRDTNDCKTDVDTDEDLDEDCVLRVHQSLSGGNTLAFSQDDVIFEPEGITTSGIKGVFTLCDSRGSDKVKGLVIGPSGRPRLAISSDNLDCS